MYNYLSDSEYINMFGVLPAERVYMLLEDQEKYEELTEVSQDVVSEVSLIEEDEFDDIKTELYLLLQNVRGSNKTTLQRIIDDLENKCTELNQSAEYSSEKIKTLKKLVG